MTRDAHRSIAAKAGLALFVAAALSGQDEDPASRWVSAFAWLQTGEQLAEAEQWPLAMGSFMEAHRQLREVARDHPEFEPEMVEYRVERLEEEMAEMEDKMTAGDHDLTMQYLDFIESFSLGQKQRFDNDFKKAFATLEEAKAVLEEIIAVKPDEFRSAVESHYVILTDSLEWLDSQINVRRPPRRSAAIPDGIEWGTTRYVKEADLPELEANEEPSGLLFPGITEEVETPGVDSEESEAPEESEEDAPDDSENEAKPATNGFRMNSEE
ncbi:MAG: hypothetical protein WD342_13140 [Verrucomicrobiales bacterium]